MTPQKVRAVVFDLGETLVNETRFWSCVAHYAGVPELTLHGVLGGLIERREENRSLFEVMQIESVDPNMIGYQIEKRDLYPDVDPVLKQLHHDGYTIGITGNQPEGVVEQIRALDIPADLIGSSTSWGVAKPDQRFFARIASELKLEPDEIMYVGDRLDNDVIPAKDFGMHAVFLRRGPWGYLHASRPKASLVQHRIDRLTEIPDLLNTISSDPAN